MDQNSNTTPSLSPQPQYQPEIQLPPQPVQTSQLAVAKKSSSLFLILSVCLLILTLIGGVSVYLWRDAEANKQKNNDATIIENLEEKITKLEQASSSVNLKTVSTQAADMQRKNDLARLQNAVVIYQSNNRGSLPSGVGTATSNTWTSFVKAYLLTGGDTFFDPLGADYIVSDNIVLPKLFDSKNPVILANVGNSCGTDGNLVTGGTRKVAFQMVLADNSIACVNN